MIYEDVCLENATTAENKTRVDEKEELYTLETTFAFFYYRHEFSEVEMKKKKCIKGSEGESVLITRQSARE